MKIIEPSYEILRIDDLTLVELAGRTCYKSEAAITDESADKFVRNLLKSGHETPLEQGFMTVKFVVDRGISHEIVRHRLASMNQESTRYCNYSAGKFGNELTFIRPFMYTGRYELMRHWEQTMAEAEQAYMEAIRLGATPEEARTLLPNSLKTEIIFTANFREWRHFFKTRACDLTGKAHPQMLQVTRPLLKEVTDLRPAVFEDLYRIVCEKPSLNLYYQTKEDFRFFGNSTETSDPKGSIKVKFPNYHLTIGEYTATCVKADVNSESGYTDYTFCFDTYIDKKMPHTRMLIKLNEWFLSYDGFDDIRNDVVAFPEPGFNCYLRVPYAGEMFDSEDGCLNSYVPDNPDGTWKEQWAHMKDVRNRAVTRDGTCEWGWLMNKMRGPDGFVLPALFGGVNIIGYPDAYADPTPYGVRPVFVIRKHHEDIKLEK